MDSSVANVTGAVFVTPTLTLTESAHNVTYGHTLVLVGGLKSNQTGVSNGAVDVHVDNQTIATVSTAANGRSGAHAKSMTIGGLEAYTSFAASAVAGTENSTYRSLANDSGSVRFLSAAALQLLLHTA